MEEFLKYSNIISKLTTEAEADILAVLKTRQYLKNENILDAGNICRHLYFINGGLLKSYFYKKNKEFVVRFFQENIIFSIFESFISEQPSKFTVLALEDTVITSMTHDNLMKLCRKHHCVETFYRKLISLATLKMTKRISEMMEDNALESYHQFAKEHPDLMQRVSLGDVAAYLGITQQSLSRIRAPK